MKTAPPSQEPAIDQDLAEALERMVAAVRARRARNAAARPGRRWRSGVDESVPTGDREEVQSEE